MPTFRAREVRDGGQRHGHGNRFASEGRRKLAEQQRDDCIPGEGAPRGLAAQLAALRAGVEGLRDDFDEAGNPPDYGEDLLAIKTTLDAVADRMAAVETSPALCRAPEEYARLINEAADKVAATPGEEVAGAATALKDAAAALDRTIRHQAYWDFLGKLVLFLAVVLPLGFLAGAVLGHFLE